MKALTIDMYLKAEILYFIIIECILVASNRITEAIFKIRSELSVSVVKKEIVKTTSYFIGVYKSAKGYFDSAAIFLASTIGIAYMISFIGGM